MEVELTFGARNMTKDELRALIQKIREWELTTARTELDVVFFTTNPQLTEMESYEIFGSITPQFKYMGHVPLPKKPLVRLGSRGIAIDGRLVGTCDELSLTIGEASETEIKDLEEAQTISLVKMGKG